MKNKSSESPIIHPAPAHSVECRWGSHVLVDGLLICSDRCSIVMATSDRCTLSFIVHEHREVILKSR
jgi:hypothetical protein